MTGRRSTCSAWLLCVAAFVAIHTLLASPSLAASRYDPRLHFRTIRTARFDIHFHQGEDSSARRLAAIAENVAATLDATLGRPSGRVHVILVNQSDVPNGWATPVPFNLIEIAAAAPGGESQIGNTDDWLRLVFTHEYTHIVHLGQSAGWIGGLRRAFGRNPALFPNLSLPLWAIEGMATFEESRQTGAGRVNAGDFRQIVTSAAASGRFEPIDRANGGLDDWPGGNAQYAYGAFFLRFLADRYGADSVQRLGAETSRRIPYFGSTAFRAVYGRSLGQLWSEFKASTNTPPADARIDATRVTFDGFTVHGPKFDRDGRLYYSRINPHGFPALMALDPGAARPRHVTTRYLGERLAVAGSLVVFDQRELAANVGLQSDLYAHSTTAGDTTRLTHGARASDPDVTQDGTALVFTTQRDERRDLSTAPLQTAPRNALGPISTLVSAPDTEFTAPQWSPDGRTVAAERHVRGRMPEIVIVDIATRAIRVVASSSRARSVSPAWTPDGSRLLFASTVDGGPFQIFVEELATGEVSRLEGAGQSAESPQVSADGGTLAFVGYTPSGYDLFTMPMADARWVRVDTLVPAVESSVRQASDVTPAPLASASAYRPWSTLAPRFWTPTAESDDGETSAGAVTTGSDALGRHAYLAAARWSASRVRPDWQASYVYDRCRPTLFVDAADDTDPYRSGVSRSREVNGGILLPWRRVRWSQSIFGALHAAVDSVDCASCVRPIRARAARNSVRTGWAFSSAKSYGYSISREEGWSVTAADEVITRALGADGEAGSVAADLRGYRRMWPRHAVLAARLGAAHAWGDDAVRRHFTASGHDPQPGGFRFGSDAVGLLRGFDDDVRGRHAAVVNLDYRFPLVRIERGRGTWPAFARVVHGAVFVDAGQAWDRALRRADLRVSTGAELSLDAVLGYILPVTLTAGAAWRHDPLDTVRGGAVFARIGRAF